MKSVAMMFTGDGHGGMEWWMGGMMLLWALPGLAILTLTVAATAWILRNMKQRDAAGDARHELDLRYARGDVTPDEYETRRKHLSG